MTRIHVFPSLSTPRLLSIWSDLAFAAILDPKYLLRILTNEDTVDGYIVNAAERHEQCFILCTMY